VRQSFTDRHRPSLEVMVPVEPEEGKSKSCSSEVPHLPYFIFEAVSGRCAEAAVVRRSSVVAFRTTSMAAAACS